MLIETEYGNDTFSGPVTPTLNGASGIPGWATSGLGLAFRHCLPPDPSLSQAQATACFAYIDGRVAVQNAVSEIADPIHWNLTSNNQ
jgi:hypothetical protein